MKIIISGGGTGGHIYPAISIANALQSRFPEVDILFVGAEGRMEMEKVPAAGYPIVGLPVAGLQRKLTWKNLCLPYKLWKSARKAAQIINDFKPDVVVGVGGYASAPVLWTAQRKNIPTVIQEQNSYAGITNKLLAKRATKICVAYEGMERFFPKEKIVLTGNPVRYRPAADGERRTVVGLRPTENGERLSACGRWRTENGYRPAADGERRTVVGLRPTENGERLSACGRWRTENGYRPAADGERLSESRSPFPVSSERSEGASRSPLAPSEAEGLSVPRSPFTVLIVGGSLGARTLNRAMMQALPELQNSGVHFIWQTGKSYFEQAKAAVNALSGERLSACGRRRTVVGLRPTENGERLSESRSPLAPSEAEGLPVPRSPLTPSEAEGLSVPRSPFTVVDFISRMDEAFAAADVVVSRAGAGTISELCVAAKACVLVPSPNVAEDHQTKNAQALVDKNAAVMVRDEEANEKLFPTVLALLKDDMRIKELEKNIAALAKPNAAAEIAEIIGERLMENGERKTVNGERKKNE
ncbi:MAG: UDP-N-acetylglucosamine--N-acetylmuramyl-(pentapeptide) pyrophosphoryl-undecaprenol N-acetylglucosamine transferase [Prevotellaceae bacterium]|nr:UDP-N-acetylglucosamine--N-acetylmuramyl-(pentapeptide) pyrophosphoryl-undecaprenol N-acetylglucosamine transferase [Prevotellaceae bacterium]